MRRISILVTVLVLLLWSPAVLANGLAGEWRGWKNREQWSVQFRADGTFSRRVSEAGRELYAESGRHQLLGDRLRIDPEGEAQGYELQIRMPDPATLEFHGEGRLLVRLSRAENIQPTPVQPTAAPTAPAQAGFRPQRPYQPNRPGGSIVFVRYEMLRASLGTESSTIPTPKLFIMNGDGGGQEPFIYPPQFDRAETPNWSPGHTHLLFASNFQMARSALYEDIFSLDAASGVIQRLTGNEWSAGPVKGYGAIVGTVHDDTIHALDQFQGETSALAGARSRVMIAVQGGGGAVYQAGRSLEEIKDAQLLWQAKDRLPMDAYKWVFVIPRVAAGKVWVKCWKSQNMGDVAVLDVAPGQVSAVELVLSKGTYAMSGPSISPDGRFLVATNLHAFFYPARPGLQRYSVKPDSYPAVVVKDLSNEWAVPAVWHNNLAGGMQAKSPRLSPDGRTLAVGVAQMETLESLALCPLESVLRGQPQPQVLVPARRVLASHQESVDTPAWSPDGRRLAFARKFLSARGDLMSDLYVLDLDGSQPRRLTQAGRNQMALNPSWSPDGRAIAFQVVTSRNQTLSMDDVAKLNFATDIWAVNADGGGLRRLTSDGRSAQPAWGP